MPIDASIYGQIGQGVKSVADYDQQYAQLDAAKQTREIGALNLLMGKRQMAAQDRTVADQEALRRVVGGFGADDSANVQSLFKAGRLKEAQDYAKAVAEAKEKAADTGLKAAQTAKYTDEQARAKRHEAYQHITSMRSAEEALASIAGSKDIPEQARGPLMQRFQSTIGNPAAFEQLKDEVLLQTLTPKDMLELLRNRGKDKIEAANKDIVLGPDGLPTANKPLWAAKNELPLAQLGETKRHNKVSEGISGANLTLARQSAGKPVYDADRGVFVNPATGVATPVTAGPGGAPIGPKAGAGGAPKISAEVQRQIGGVVSFDKDLNALEEALKDFDPRNPLDQGNTTKRARIQSLGKQAQLSAKEAAALGALSGPDMALLEGILNDPTSIKGAVSGSKGIAAQISEARAGNRRRVDSLSAQYGDKSMEGVKGALDSAPSTSAPAAGPARIKSDADYNALPSGATFVGPDGKTRRKP